MKDEVLERVWRNRRAISARCDFDPRKLVKFYQQQDKMRVDEKVQSTSISMEKKPH